MPLLAAARQGDPIAHTSMIAMIGKVGTGMLVGAAVGFLAGAAATALLVGTVLSGGLLGLVAAAVVTSLILYDVNGVLKMTGAPSVGGIIENASNAVGDLLSEAWPPTVEGAIAESSPDVFINRKQAARAVDKGEDNVALCHRHPPNPNQYAAEGSSSVFINGYPAHRKGERITCDAKTSAGSANVFIGGDSRQMREISSEMPWWLENASLAIGIALALCTKDWKSILPKIGCLALNVGIGMAVNAVFGNPVHVATGAKLLDGSDDTDFALPARIPLEWVRSYNSMDVRDGLFGPGWSVPLSVQLRINQSGTYPNIFIDLQGREIPFEAVEAGQSQWNTAEGWRLARTLGGHYVVEGLDGLYREFGPAPSETPDSPHTLSLQRIEDQNANYLALRYNTANQLYEIADCAGRLYKCHYDRVHPGRLAGITLHTDRETPVLALVRYTYDRMGRLQSVIDRAGEQIRSFTWHDSGLMASHTLSAGLQCHYEWADFPDRPRVVRHRTSDGQFWHADYEVRSDGGQTVVTDHLGRRQQWQWDAYSRITGYTDALGRRSTLAWNEDGLLVGSTQPNGGEWTYVYDERGNLAEETDPLGNIGTTAWKRDAPLPLVETDAGGRIRRYEYDEKSNLIAMDGTAGRTEIGRDRHGQPQSVTDPRGGISHWLWHESGQPAAYTDCSGRITRTTYDALGQRLTETDPAENTTAYEYDAAGRVEKVVLADGSTRRWRWHSSGLLEQKADGLDQVTRFAWNSQGRLTARIDALGHRIELNYDSAGNLKRLRNENGEFYQFDHDAADQLVLQIGLDGIRSEYTLDKQGLPAQAKQFSPGADETAQQFERDLLGRLTAKITHETVTRYRYDAAGQLTHVERRTKNAGTGNMPDALIDTLAFVYDAQGNLAEEQSTQYRLKGKALGTPRTRILRHRHDILGNRIATELPQQRTLNYLYYGSGHLHQINLDGEPVSDIERDAAHREISRTQGELLSHFQRDALGRRTGQHARRRSGGNVSGDVVRKGFAFDANGELVRRIDPLLGDRQYAYDAIGRIVSAQSSQEQEGSRSIALAEAFAWDPASNLCSPANRQGAVLHNRIAVHGDRRYEYDSLGRLIVKRVGKHTVIRLNWNRENQLAEAHTTRNGLTQRTGYDYDALGRRIAKHDIFGSTYFTWEGMRLIQEQRGAGTVTYIYEPDSYEPLARIDFQTDLLETARQPDRSAPLKINAYYFHTDINGAPEEMTNRQGALVWQARYAVWGNTVAEQWSQSHRPDPDGLSATQPLPQNLRMQGQYYDAETGLHYNTFRYYDSDIGRFVSPDPIGLVGGINLYQYAPNPISWIDPWGLTNLNSNNATGDWALYKVKDPNTGIAKVGIGKANDVMADGTNRRAYTSGRLARKNPAFPNAQPEIISQHKGITKGAMKEIEAAEVRRLRAEGHALPLNREKDRRYRGGGCGGR